MKRLDLTAHVSVHGRELRRERVRPSWWHNESLNKPSAVPRHSDIHDQRVRKICRDPGVAGA